VLILKTVCGICRVCNERRYDIVLSENTCVWCLKEKEKNHTARVKRLVDEYSEFDLMRGSRQLLFQPLAISNAYKNGCLIDIVDNIKRDMSDHGITKVLRLYFQLLKDEGHKKLIMCVKIGKRVHKINLFDLMFEKELSNYNDVFAYIRNSDNLVDEFNIEFR